MLKLTLLFIHYFLTTGTFASSFELIEEPFLLEEHKPLIIDVDVKKTLQTRSNIEKVINYMTPVKSQKRRGTCTLFSTLGLIEAHLIRKNHVIKEEIDLSEQWLEYIIMTKKSTEGSSHTKNVKAILKYGIANESIWPYHENRWRSLDDEPMAYALCGHLDDGTDPILNSLLQSCLLGQRDPRLLSLSDQEVLRRDSEFLPIRDDAKNMKAKYIDDFVREKKSYRLKRLSTARNLLKKDIPLAIALKLYYGAWNAKKTETFEIQKRDKSLWYKGIVSHPIEGSKDREISATNGGRHSMIIVGFDDNIEIEGRMLLKDGTWKSTIHKGAYIFKNSWGVRGSGRDFKLNGSNYPGYGMISYDYAHEFGTWFHIPTRGIVEN